MQIRFFYPMWGSSHMPLQQFLKTVRDTGYHGIEMNIPFDPDYAAELKRGLSEYGLLLIAQQWLPPVDETAGGYIQRMEKYLHHLTSFQPLFINSHTGRDFYSFEDNCRIFEACDRIQSATGVKIVHETHRGRALYSTASTRLFFEKFPGLRINADFSHWCCVSESLLEDQTDFMVRAMERTDYIHARVGHAQGPQVSDPGLKDNETALNAHLAWWKQIIINARNSGKSEMDICTEFGPEPYMLKFPFTDRPIADQWVINLYMKKVIEDTLKI
jgi:sugar phosphate isomerase/epimerase